MNETLQKATQLLQNGEAEEALLLLNELDASTTDGEQLRATCKKALSEQYLWLLNDAAKNNQMGDIRKFTSKYLYLIGKDERIEKYEKMVSSSQVSMDTQQQQQSKDAAVYNIGRLAIVPVIFLLLGLLINIFWRQLADWSLLESWSSDLGLNHSSILLSYLTTIIYILYLATFIVVFLLLDELKWDTFKPYMICFCIGGFMTLFCCIADIVYGFNYSSPGVLQGVRISLAIASVLIMISLIKKMSDSIKYKVPLIIAIVAMGLELVYCLLSIYVFHMQDQQIYETSYLELCYRNMNIIYYGKTVLMIISCLTIFAVSQRTKSKQ